MSLNLLYPPTSSPSLPFLSSSSHTPNRVTTLHFKISSSSSSNQTIQIDGEIDEFNSRTPTPTSSKKRRKPRPSFSDQIRDKWGVKTVSLRDKFPWQERQKVKLTFEEEEEEEEEEDEDYDEEEETQFVGDSRIGDDSVVGDSLSFGHGNRIKVAPWVQERKPRKVEGKRENGFAGNEEKVVSTRIVEGKDGGNDAIGSGVLEKKEIFGVKIDERGLCSKNGSKNGGNFRDYEGFRDEFGSEKLPLEGESGLRNDGIRIGLLEEKESLGAKIHDKVSFTQKVSEIEGKKDREFEGRFDQFDSTKLPLKRALGFKNVGGEEGLLEKKKILPVKIDEKISFNQEVAKIDGGEVQNSNIDSSKLPWEGDIGSKNVEGGKEDTKKSNTWLAEKLIPEHELKRLRNVALRMVERIQVKTAGITQSLVDSIHENWKVDEVVKLKFEGSSTMNMKRTHEHLESRTGGLVIWRSGSSFVLFRGMSYKLRCVQQFKQMEADNKLSSSVKAIENGHSRTAEQNKAISSLESPINHSSRDSTNLSEEELVELNELNLLLDGLGPRYTDWNGRDPVPVDADLLPSVICGYKPPFRYLPHGVRHALRDSETTFYRRNARTTPPHFALGRNRELQGLAAAMVKLWEKSAIAKIAIKRGVHNTSNERMAEDLKSLTGGTLLSRNKEYIVLYRGNDFLPPNVTKTLEEAKEVASLQLDDEDKARQKASIIVNSNPKVAKGPLVAGTLAETMAATARWGSEVSDEHREKVMREAAVARHASLVRFLDKKLAIAKGKITLAEKALRKVQEKLDPSELPTDLETLTDEERYLFRKIGLSMKPYLYLGRRGVFDGTIENMHLHWKYRELVKIFVEGKRYAQVKHVAISLEAESGGVLVSVEKTLKGHAIIVYRGKNYQCPDKVKPTNLLTRRQALARSIELQRREALKRHVSELKERIEKLKSELEDMKTIDEIDEATLYSRVDEGSDDDDPDYNEEVEDEEAYLEIYDGNQDESTRNERL